MALLALVALSGTPAARAWQALPYRLHQGLVAGDLHMGVRLLGALQLPRTQVDGIELVEISALAYDADADLLYLLSDQGALFHSRVHAGEDGLLDLELVSAHALRDAAGSPLRGRAADSEGMSGLDTDNGRVDDARLLLSFEREARVAEYRPDGRLIREHKLPRGLDPRRFASINRGPEAITSDPDGRYFVAAERPLRGDDPDRLAIFASDGRRWSYRLANGRSALVAMEWLDADRLMVLERDFDRLLYRLVTRLRIASGLAGDDAELTVRDLAHFDNREGWRVDNFEGLTRWLGERFLIVSDDNDNILQRTLLLMFEPLAEGGAGAPKYDPVQEAGR